MQGKESKNDLEASWEEEDEKQRVRLGFYACQ